MPTAPAPIPSLSPRRFLPFFLYPEARCSSPSPRRFLPFFLYPEARCSSPSFHSLPCGGLLGLILERAPIAEGEGQSRHLLRLFVSLCLISLLLRLLCTIDRILHFFPSSFLFIAFTVPSQRCFHASTGLSVQPKPKPEVFTALSPSRLETGSDDPLLYSNSFTCRWKRPLKVKTMQQLSASSLPSFHSTLFFT